MVMHSAGICGSRDSEVGGNEGLLITQQLRDPIGEVGWRRIQPSARRARGMARCRARGKLGTAVCCLCLASHDGDASLFSRLVERCTIRDLCYVELSRSTSSYIRERSHSAAPFYATKPQPGVTGLRKEVKVFRAHWEYSFHFPHQGNTRITVSTPHYLLTTGQTPPTPHAPLTNNKTFLYPPNQKNHKASTS